MSNDAYWRIAERNLNFVLENQNADGSWYYAMDGVRDFVDHFHTCFVMKALAKIHTLTGHQACLDALAKGVKYYLENLFDLDGLPRPFSKAPRLTVYKRELYDCAESINLCLLLRDRFPQLETTLQTVIGGILNDWIKPDGSFRSRRLHFGWDNVPMHRWAQSQMFCALAYYLAEAQAPILNRRSELTTMCGICGQFNFEHAGTGVSGNDPADGELHRSSRARRRGYYLAGPLGLGFRRLSIIDLAGGHQPMSDAEEKIWVVFNGEIYNFPELRAELESRHRFRTNSDTEVIVHGYKEWGTDVFNRLNGMFGLAIWDVDRRRLVVARDAMGIKLVYYRIADGCLTFGSEIRAVQAAADSEPDVDPIRPQLVSPVPLHAFAVHHLQRNSKARARNDAGGRRRSMPGGALVQVYAGSF